MYTDQLRIDLVNKGVETGGGILVYAPPKSGQANYFIR